MPGGGKQQREGAGVVQGGCRGECTAVQSSAGGSGYVRWHWPIATTRGEGVQLSRGRPKGERAQMPCLPS